MRKRLLDISKKIDPLDLKVLKKIKEVADSLQLDFFIIGATVRDMILHYVYDIKIYRRTNDIDFAVRVKNWDEYYKLTAEIEKVGFKKDKRITHRFYYDGIVVDFIPFGEIADEKNDLTWPDKEKKKMNLIGFDDAYFSSEEILIQTELDIVIKTASVESLVMLKIFAWNDRRADDRLKDARDLYLIMSTYIRAGNEARIYEEHPDIVEEAKDYELAGARLLGRDIISVARDSVIKHLLEILNKERIAILANEMAQYEGLVTERDVRTEKCVNLLMNMRLGLENKKGV